MHTRKKSLSRTEWSLMNICWRKGKISARDVFDETLKEKKRGYQTVKTMLDRMVEKGFLAREKFGPIWLYEPMVTRASVMKREIESFIGIVLDNSVAPLFAHLADRESLSDEELAALKKLVDEQGGND